jgi:hypothetical protein
MYCGMDVFIKWRREGAESTISSWLHGLKVSLVNDMVDTL